MSVLDPIAVLIVLPLAWATLAFLLGRDRGAWLAIVGVGVQLGAALLLAARVQGAGAQGQALGGWEAPLGIALFADGLATLMLLLTQLVALPLMIYARAYFARPLGEPGGSGWFFPLTGYLLAGMNALFLSADLFNLYVTLEIVGLTAVGLVALAGGAQQVAAALRYLFATLAGSGAYLLGVALIYGAYGNVAIAEVSAAIGADAPRAVWFAAALMAVGLLIKTALFPFHYWLPPAHGGAAAPVSALLSALVVKASFYLLLRLALGPFAPFPEAASTLFALLGTAAILWGSYRAIRAARLKMLIAYSTVAQLGYLFLIFPLLGPGGVAVQAGVLHAVSHGLAKAAMFAAAGVLIKVSGRDGVADVAGAAARLPVTLFAFGLAGVAIMGLPPSGGFLAKWLLIEAAMERGLWWIAAVAIVGGLLAAIYVFRVLRQAFLPAGSNGCSRSAPGALELSTLFLAAASVLIGLRGMEIVTLLEAGAVP